MPSSHFALVSVFTSKQFKSFEDSQNQIKIFFTTVNRLVLSVDAFFKFFKFFHFAINVHKYRDTGKNNESMRIYYTNICCTNTFLKDKTHLVYSGCVVHVNWTHPPLSLWCHVN